MEGFLTKCKEDTVPKCFTCLSVGRKMFSLSNHEDTFNQIVLDHHLNNIAQAVICWECKALLTKIEKFKMQAKQALKVLNKSVHENIKLSNLTSVLITRNDIYFSNNESNEKYNLLESEIKNELASLSSIKEIEREDVNSESECVAIIDFIPKNEDDVHKINIKEENLKRVEKTIINDNITRNLSKRNLIIYEESTEIIQKRCKTVNKINNEDTNVDIKCEVTNIINKNLKENISKTTENKKRKRKKINTNDLEPVNLFKKNQRLYKAMSRIHSQINEMVEKVCLTNSQFNDQLQIELDSDVYKKKTYKCVSCITGWNTKSVFDRHNDMVHDKKNGKYVCDICKKRFKVLACLESHKGEHYSCYSCRICNYRNKKKRLMKLHMENHFKYYKCKCKISFKDPDDCLEHYQQFHQNLICNECGKCYQKKELLIKHIRSFHNYECNACTMTFKSRVNLSVHVRRRHPKMEHTPAYCVECNLNFKSEHAYKSHLYYNKVHRHAVKRVACPECDKTFYRAVYMRNHYKYVHLKEVTYKCEECNKSFMKKRSLNIHLQHIHEGKGTLKNKICHICGRGFSTNFILKHHICTHTGERPLACPHCPAKFIQMTSLKQHLKRQHNTDNPQ